MRTAIVAAVCVIWFQLQCPSADSAARMGLYIGGRTNDTRTHAQKLLQERGGAPAAPAAKSSTILQTAGTVDWRDVNGMRYQVGQLRDWYRRKTGKRPLQSWDLFRGRVVEIRADVVMLQLFDSGTEVLTPLVAAVRNWPGSPVRGMLGSVYAMEMSARYRDADGQPILMLDCGKLLTPPAAPKSREQLEKEAYQKRYGVAP